MAVSVTLLIGALAVVAQSAGAKPGKSNPRLHAFGSCDTLRDYARRNGLRLIGGVAPRPIMVPEMDGRSEDQSSESE